jgi:peptide-methionine (S)-S-oxide reductase
MAEAIFASGCFWCAERDFEKAPGVVDVVSGYAGGSEPAPTYEEVSAGQTGHAEAVRVVYDPARASYAQLLQYFLHHTDVLDGGGQFCDRGKQYRPVIFPRTPAEKEAAKQALEGVRARFGRAPAVTLEEARSFWVAEGYHQDFSRKDPVRYTSYRKGCGRDARVRVLWGDTP